MHSVPSFGSVVNSLPKKSSPEFMEAILHAAVQIVVIKGVSFYANLRKHSGLLKHLTRLGHSPQSCDSTHSSNCRHFFKSNYCYFFFFFNPCLSQSAQCNTVWSCFIGAAAVWNNNHDKTGPQNRGRGRKGQAETNNDVWMCVLACVRGGVHVCVHLWDSVRELIK